MDMAWYQLDLHRRGPWQRGGRTNWRRILQLTLFGLVSGILLGIVALVATRLVRPSGVVSATSRA